IKRRIPIDWPMAISVLSLMIIGAAFVHSARLATEVNLELAWYQRLAFKQIIWYLIGIGGLVAACIFDYHSLARWSYVGYWGTIILLILVMIPLIGAIRFGARRWIDLGPFSLQPSEFSKLAFILAMANFLSRPLDELKLRGNFGKALGSPHYIGGFYSFIC
ncbi:MAG: FtsW/RodA/SpoVE family cell cycle protein, partial [Cryomorphaceae bacterium]|nr:FtsW/RodA/SpoVE family cell cycle protein [Cryomorphaceae bacterium]